MQAARFLLTYTTCRSLKAHYTVAVAVLTASYIYSLFWVVFAHGHASLDKCKETDAVNSLLNSARLGAVQCTLRLQ